MKTSLQNKFEDSLMTCDFVEFEMVVCYTEISMNKCENKVY